MSEKKEGAAANHHDATPSSIVPPNTIDFIGKKFANLRRLLVAGLIFIVLILVGTIFPNLFPGREKAPNANVIKLLEDQRKQYDSIAKRNIILMEQYIKHAEDRQLRDSLILLQGQKRLLQALNDIKPLYEKIPTYTDLSKDSLRRLHAARFQ